MVGGSVSVGGLDAAARQMLLRPSNLARISGGLDQLERHRVSRMKGPGPLMSLVRYRAVAKVDSMGVCGAWVDPKLSGYLISWPMSA